jgi:DNA polymerase-3 subunit delta'
MSEAKALQDLRGKLCPWLAPELAQLERAVAADHLGHGWLLAGPRGIGKINLALVLAERILNPALRDTAPAALTAAEAAAAMPLRHSPFDHHPDFHWLFPEEDKRTISVEQVRAVTAQLSLKAYRGSSKAVIIEPAEAMTAGAANALLKTLEEPTPDTYLLLVSHQPGRLPATIRSRCQALALRAPSAAQLAAWLGGEARPRALGMPLVPVRLGQSGNDALDNNINKLEDIINRISSKKVDPQSVADEWLKLDLDALLAALAGLLQQTIRARFVTEDSNPITDLPVRRLHNVASKLTLAALFRQLQATERLREQIGRGTNVELALRVLLMDFDPARGTT